MKLRIAVAAVSSVALLLCGTAAGATPYGNGWAIPLKADTPSWFTPELAARVHASAPAAIPAPNDAPLPSEVGIRPGSWMIFPAGCTMNFVFQSGGNYAIGTPATAGTSAIP